MPKIKLTELILRDAHQSLFATRMVTSDMLPICGKLDNVGYYAIEAWGGATFDSCIRFLNEDPWERLKQLKKALPKTPIMMLLRGQNLLGYRHYADDVVEKFVEYAAKNGVDIFRIFDAVNDPRNFITATKAAKKTGKHIQATISYALTPYHTVEKYADFAKELVQIGADSICIKDMAGLLRPYEGYELVKAVKKATGLPVDVHTHATTGMSVAALVKCAEAGAEVVDTAISSMAMGPGHSPTETMVEIFKGTEYDTGLDIDLLLEIAAYFRDIRRNYKQFETSFLGADTRLLKSQVPGGMLSNMESQLKEQGAAGKMDEVLKEIEVVHKDSGYPPLVTPTSQIVGTQAVFNVLFGRYNRLAGEFQDLIAGKYGTCPAPKNKDVVKKALEALKMEKEITHRPANDITPEYSKLEDEAKKLLGTSTVTPEDVLTLAMFPKVAPGFFKKRAEGPVVFKPQSDTPAAPAVPVATAAMPAAVAGTTESYNVNINGTDYAVTVSPAANAATPAVVAASVSAATAAPAAAPTGTQIPAPVACSIFKHAVAEGAQVAEGDTVVIIESMKMELEVKATAAGKVHFLLPEGAKAAAGQPIAEIGGESAAAPASNSGTQIPAPVACSIFKHAVAEGAQVAEGDTVVIIESMKMELEVKATAAGKVHFLLPEGAKAAAGQPIAEIG